VRPTFFDNGDFHGAFVVGDAGERIVRRTLHSVPFFAKAVFRRVDADII
jgi:hypothetical protein